MKSRKQRKMNFSFMWAFIGLIAITFAIRQVEVIRIRNRLMQLESEIEYYMMLNSALEEQIKTLQSDEYIEKTAREKLGLVMPGEVQYIPIKDGNGRYDGTTP
ncbi:MAG TPA: septum formation initiator family protein [Bacillota bacterium]|mgnify:FL=1|nr:septum formation initiator family protein [Bacillota bacterium]HPT35994.1 septum formation initiator family protein [Bacillota bacterium]